MLALVLGLSVLIYLPLRGPGQGVPDLVTASGFLDHVLARGFGGEADLNGDGRITAGEISDFVLTEMPKIHISDTSHSSRRAQHPESSRTVAYDTVLVRLGE